MSPNEIHDCEPSRVADEVGTILRDLPNAM